MGVPSLTKASLSLPQGNAICYSGYREGQSPGEQIFPSREEILEDLLILQKNWSLLRLYDCSLHAERVLEVIETEQLPFKVLLGAYLAAELNNFGCPWGGTYTEEQLALNRAENAAELQRLIRLARRYEPLVFAVAVGNECTVEWSDHIVAVPQMVAYVQQVKQAIQQPITFCENYVPWVTKLAPLVEVLDFISVHTYPVWEYKRIDEAITYTRDNVESVARCYPDKPVIITEAGWATHTNGRGMPLEQASESLQEVYYRALMSWSQEARLLTFVFEAFDEPWKGSPDPMEPEKHWGLFTVDRQPKLVMQGLFGAPAR